MTDALQFIVMIAAILAIIFMGMDSAGGWTNVWEAAERGNRLQFFKLVAKRKVNCICITSTITFFH